MWWFAFALVPVASQRLSLDAPESLDAAAVSMQLRAAAAARGEAGRFGLRSLEAPPNCAENAAPFWVAAPQAAAGAREAFGPSVGRMIWDSGGWALVESFLLAAVLDDLTSGDVGACDGLGLDVTVVDIGAHVGYFSMLSLSMPKARVVAFEPGAEHEPLLRLSAALNGVVDRFALFAAPVAAAETVRYDGWSIERDGQFNETAATTRQTTRCDVAVEQAEEAWGVGATPIAWLKVDVEGAEAGVLQSARRLFERDAGARPQVVYLELSWFEAAEAGALKSASFHNAVACLVGLLIGGYGVRIVRSGGIEWDCEEPRSSRDCAFARPADGDGWLDFVAIEAGFPHATAARGLLDSWGLCDRREASEARGFCQLEVRLPKRNRLTRRLEKNRSSQSPPSTRSAFRRASHRPASAKIGKGKPSRERW
ncbi:S-adenosyl-L-methionine-dependent methyltransferase [Pelagophyceae sp. CCMP2097]|nr:S-adenosyl-L-methionine-dependent methyltransferase [Pelagophyceae sp. CCMP2097]